METQKSTTKICFKPMSGMKLVFEPAQGLQEPAKKHACADCHFCQHCSDTRCHSCRGKKNRPAGLATGKLSLCEQVRLYEKINARA